LFGYQIKGDKQKGCVTHERGKVHAGFSQGNRRNRKHFEGLCKYVAFIIKVDLQKVGLVYGLN
jgi:hypothetical protein